MLVCEFVFSVPAYRPGQRSIIFSSPLALVAPDGIYNVNRTASELLQWDQLESWSERLLRFTSTVDTSMRTPFIGHFSIKNLNQQPEMYAFVSSVCFNS
jgi:hypothetical protein